MREISLVKKANMYVYKQMCKYICGMSCPEKASQQNKNVFFQKKYPRVKKYQKQFKIFEEYLRELEHAHTDR